MTNEEIWKHLCKKKPALENPKAEVTFTSEQLRKLVRQVHDQGVALGQARAQSRSPADNLFKDFFGV